MGKKILSEFKSQLYPISLYVGFSENLNDILCNFKDINGVVSGEWDDCDALSYCEMWDKNGKYSNLLVFRNKTVATNGIIAHEATHAAYRIWEHIGEKEYGNEANAYLVEWIVNCVDETKKLKFCI